MKKRLSTLGLAVYILSSGIVGAQVQLGNDIDGEAANNWSGRSVSMPNSETVAIGAPENDEIASNAGHVRVYEGNGSAWIQKGNDIDGRNPFDHAGTIVSMPTANCLAMGVPGNAQSVNPYGRVEVHTWNGAAWVQKGSDIPGLSAGERFGFAVSMPDENTVAIGAQGGEFFPVNTNGKALVYNWNGTDWILKGSVLSGEAINDNFGYNVEMPDANTLAVSAIFNDGAGADAGHVRIYTYNGTDWMQKGGDLDGEASGNNSGWSISMPNANIIAIGAPKNAGGLFQNGHTRVYSWSGSVWVQKGSDIDGETVAEQSGYAVSMGDEDHLAIGSPFNDDEAPYIGKVNVFRWNGAEWSQLLDGIYGEAQDDESGNALCMPDANTLAIGAYKNEGNGNDAGHVRIYSLEENSSVEEQVPLGFNIMPNPNSGVFTLQFNIAADPTRLELSNMHGQLLYEATVLDKKVVHFDLELTPGFYFLSAVSEKGPSSVRKIIISE